MYTSCHRITTESSIPSSLRVKYDVTKPIVSKLRFAMLLYCKTNCGLQCRRSSWRTMSETEERREAECSTNSSDFSSITCISNSGDTGSSSADRTTPSSSDKTVASGTSSSSSSSSSPGDDGQTADYCDSSRSCDPVLPPSSDAESDFSAYRSSNDEVDDTDQRVVSTNGVTSGTGEGEQADDRRCPSDDVGDVASVVESTGTVEEHRCDSSELSSLSFDELRQLAAELLPVLDSMLSSSPNVSRSKQQSSVADASGTVVDVMSSESAHVADMTDEKNVGTGLPIEIGGHVEGDELSNEKACTSTTEVVQADPSASQKNLPTTLVEPTTSPVSDKRSSVTRLTTKMPLSTPPSITEPLQRTSEERQPATVTPVSPEVDSTIDNDETVLQCSRPCENNHIDEHSTNPESGRKLTSDESRFDTLSVENNSDTPTVATPTTDSRRTTDSNNGVDSADRCGDTSSTTTTTTTTKIGGDDVLSNSEVEEEERCSSVEDKTEGGVLSKYERIAVMMKLQKEMATMQLEMSRLRDAMRSADSLLQQLMDSEFDES